MQRDWRPPNVAAHHRNYAVTGTSSDIIPCCGSRPLPDAILPPWNLDPILIACLAAVAFAYTVGARYLDRSGGVFTRGAQAAFYAGWAVATATLLSPLCALSVSLFAARVVQHMILALIAAPLLTPQILRDARDARDPADELRERRRAR